MNGPTRSLGSVSRLKWVKPGAASIATLAVISVLVLAFPQPLFAYTLTYGRFHVWSDRPIDPSMNAVLNDSGKRMARSELYAPGEPYRVFICNSAWRLLVYSQMLNDKLGGLTDSWLTRNIYIRAADIPRNQIISPNPELIRDAAERPLSYFIAHEATHVMQSRSFGRLMALHTPLWLVEGYADHIGKGGTFEFGKNRTMLTMNDPEMDYARSGRYRTVNLEVALLLDKRRLSNRQIFANPPEQTDMPTLLKSRVLIKFASDNADRSTNRIAVEGMVVSPSLDCVTVLSASLIRSGYLV